MAGTNNPFMHYVDDFEKEAEEFLQKYGCSDAINNPQPIPIRDIATRLMSLEIIDTEYLSLNDSVQGAIAFTKGIIEVYDWSTQECIGYEVTQPSIFVDTDILNIGRYNNTLAHECYHWWRHRNYFTYKRTHENGTEFAFRCNKRLSPTGSLLGGEWSDIDKMEWQAKTIAPKILMPRNAMRIKVEKEYRRLLSGDKSLNRRAVTPLVIEAVSDFFEVSRQSAAIRMLELGYNEAEAFCDMVSQEIHPSQPNYKTTKAKRHQRPISLTQAFELYQSHEFLKAILDTGAFRFVDGYFVINHETYVQNNQLTEYANSHLAECTLDFSVKLQPDYLMHSDARMMFRSDSVFKETTSFDNNTQNTELFNRAKDFEKKLKRAQASAQTPAQWMKQRMTEEHWYESTFEEKTGLDKMNYSRVQKETHRFTMLPLLAMGVGLSLDCTEMTEVLKLGGMTFIPGNRDHEAYKYLFTAMYGKGIDECNAFLEEVGVETLGTKQRL